MTLSVTSQPARLPAFGAQPAAIRTSSQAAVRFGFDLDSENADQEARARTSYALHCIREAFGKDQPKDWQPPFVRLSVLRKDLDGKFKETGTYHTSSQTVRGRGRESFFNAPLGRKPLQYGTWQISHLVADTKDVSDHTRVPRKLVTKGLRLLSRLNGDETPYLAIRTDGNFTSSILIDRFKETLAKDKNLPFTDEDIRYGDHNMVVVRLSKFKAGGLRSLLPKPGDKSLLGLRGWKPYQKEKSSL